MAETHNVRGAELDSSVATSVRGFVIQEILAHWWGVVLHQEAARVQSDKGSKDLILV